MSLDLTSILAEIERLGDRVAQQSDARARLIPIALQALQAAAAMDPELLQGKIRAAGTRWPGALPTEDALDANFGPASLPEKYHVIGADGSQVYPDRHASALYYLINIGAIRVYYGSESPPAVFSRPTLGHEPEELRTIDGRRVDASIINARRDVAELAELARLAGDLETGPILALMDNGLLLWFLLQLGGAASAEADRLLDDYLSRLDEIKESGAALAGYIDRPASANVLALLYLSKLPQERIDETELRENPFRPLSDREIFSWLPPGHRSARFVNASPVNQRFQMAGHQIQFFYLNLGESAGIVRVEIPSWVAQAPYLLELAHAGILAQCEALAGFPYVLARAHELAIVTQPERETLDRMLDDELMRRGIRPQASRKALAKRWLGGVRRHRL
jgi:hypothetical protein